MIVEIINKEIFDNYTRFLFVYGNRGGGKSTTIANKFIKDTIENPLSKSLAVRKTSPSLKITIIRMIKEELLKWGIPYKMVADNITFPNGSLIDFQSLYLTGGGRNERIKSATYDRIWGEEPTEFTLEDFYNLDEILRGNKGHNQMILTFNPPARNTNPVYKWYDIQKERADRVFFDNHNNPYIPKEYLEQLDRLKEHDVGRHKRYALGEWGVDTTQALVYPKWNSVNEFPECEQIIYGMDFGFNNPSAIVKIGIRENEIYCQELLYQRHLTNGELIKEMDKLDIRDSIYADSAEPARIREIGEAGYDIHSANKKVLEGIEAVKSYIINIVNSPNMEEEIREYAFKRDRAGNILEDPVKFNDHDMDSMRYGVISTKINISSLAFG